MKHTNIFVENSKPLSQAQKDEIGRAVRGYIQNDLGMPLPEKAQQAQKDEEEQAQKDKIPEE